MRARADFGQLTKALRKFFGSRRVPEQDVEDLVQETLLRVLQRSRTTSPDSPKAFAIGIAKKVFLEHCRRVKKAQSHCDISDVVGLASHSNPLEDVLRRERVALFRKELARLPERMSSLLIRRFVDEVLSRTVADENGTSVKAIDGRVSRARRKLKQSMERAGGTHVKRAA